MLGTVGARHLGRDVAVVLEEVQVAPGELGEVVRLARLAAHRAGEQAAAVGGDLKVQFMRLFAGIQALTDQSPRRRHPQSQSQYGIRVHLRPVRLNLLQRASVLVTVQDATRRCAMACGHPGPSLRAPASRAQLGTRGWSSSVEQEDDTSTRSRVTWGFWPLPETPKSTYSIEEAFRASHSSTEAGGMLRERGPQPRSRECACDRHPPWSRCAPQAGPPAPERRWPGQVGGRFIPPRLAPFP